MRMLWPIFTTLRGTAARGPGLLFSMVSSSGDISSGHSLPIIFKVNI